MAENINWSSFYFPTSERCIAEFEILNAKLEVQLKADLNKEIYTQNIIEEKEVAIIDYLSKVNQLKEDVLTPESDLYVTPELTPTDVRHNFGQTRCVSDGGLNSLVESFDSKYLQATNTLYYSLVTVDEIYSSDSHDVLEKELAEQDQLFKSFTSIISRDSKGSKRETRSCALSPVNKTPLLQNSLLKNSVSKRKQGLDLKLTVKSNFKDKFSFTHSENHVTSNKFPKSSNPLSGVGIINKLSSLLDGSHEFHNSHDDNKLISSFVGFKQCKVSAMSRPKTESDEAMEAESVGPDSCLEAASSCYLTGSSPKDHTVSETCYGDLTEVATSEDIPHDNDQSARSSSMSSDAGTWDTNYQLASEISIKDNFLEDHEQKSAFLSDYDKNKPKANQDVTANETRNLFLNSNSNAVHQTNILPVNNETHHNFSKHILKENSSENHITPRTSNIPIIDHLNACSSQILSDESIEAKLPSGINNFFIDAASLLDESEISSIPPNSLICNGHETVDDSYCPWTDLEMNNKQLKKTNVRKQWEVSEEANIECKNIMQVVEKSDFEKRRCSLIRRNTFELELDGERLAVLRNEYERHKDKVLNKTGMVSSLITTEMNSYMSEASETSTERNALNSLPTTLKPTGVIEKCDDEVHSPDSLNDGPLENAFRDTSESDPCCSLPLELNNKIIDTSRDEKRTNYFAVSGNSTSLFDNIVESDANSSGRYVDDNHISKASISKITNQIDFTPKVSCGKSLSDLALQENSFSSPIMNRRKTEFAPILSGGIVLEPEPREVETKSKASLSLTSSWIIDMSGAAKSPPEFRKSHQSDPLSSLNSCDSDKSIERPTKTSSSSLGFFVPLEDPIDEKSSADSGYKSSNFQLNRNENNIFKVENMSSSNNSSSCGFYVDLNDENLLNEKALEKETPVPDKKLFSMFIDFGEPGKGNGTKSKMNTPHVFKKRSHTRTNSVVFPEKLDNKSRFNDSQISSESSLELTDSTELNKNKTLIGTVTDQPLPVKQLFASSNCKPVASNKKQGFYMFIEANPSPVSQRRTLPSGSQPSSQRHSWNLETHDWTPPETGCSGENAPKKTHRRFHSVSVNKSIDVMFNIDQSDKSTSFLPLAKVSTSNLNGIESGPPSVDETVNRPNSLIYSWHGCVKPSIELQKGIARRDCKDINTNSMKSPLESKPDLFSEMNKSTDKSDEITYSSSKGDLSIASNESSSTGIRNSTFVASDISNVANATSNELDITSPTCDVMSQLSKDDSDKTETDFDDGERRSGDVPRTPDHSISQVDIPIIEHKFSFVKLSDMDKEPKKVISEEKNIANRMSRSIPEASWIENKMMTRSATSRSLSRLFPHLNSSLRNKTPDSTELETDFSEISSMQSSMDPSALDGSTEETDASSGGGAPVTRLGEDLLRMFLDEISPDVTVEVGGRRIKAHKCILSSRCQYFAAILSGGWVESAGNVISLQGFSYNAVHFALCHIYSGASNIPDSINIVELATLADMLCLEGLKEVIMYTLKVKYCHFFHKPCPMCLVGVLECLPLAAAYGLDEIYRKSLRWITKYFVRVWPTKGFATLPRELLDKCYKQHIVHMNVDNVLETVLCCSKLQGLIPSVRWAEPVYALSTKLYEAAVKFISQHFCEILSMDMFMTLGKEQMWTMSHLEETLLTAAEKLPPDQACKSHSHLYKLTNHLSSLSSPFDMKINDGFLEFVRLLSTMVENCLLKQAARASRTPAWILMEPQLRHKIQDAACLVIVPGDDRRRARHLLKRGESANTSKRSTDLVPSKQAVMETSVTKKLVPTKGPLPIAKPKTPQPLSKAENSGPRPKTWPYKMSEVKSRYLEPKQTPKQSPAFTSSKQDKTNTLTPTVRRNVSKSIISSSDSSRTSSPATRRALPQRLVRVSGKDKVKPEDSLTMSTDSLADPSVSAKKKEAGPGVNKVTKVDFVERNARVLTVRAGKTKGSSVDPNPTIRLSQSDLKSKPATVTKLEGDKPKYSPVILSKRSSSQNSPVVKHSPVPPVKSTVNSTPSPSNRHNALSPKDKSHGIVDTKSSVLKRNSTYRVQAKSSSPLKVATVKTKESAAGVIKEPKGNINRIQPKGNSCKKSTTNNNILNNNKTETKAQPMVGSRSGTFLKDEPTVLKKPQVFSVSE